MLGVFPEKTTFVTVLQISIAPPAFGIRLFVTVSPSTLVMPIESGDEVGLSEVMPV